MQGTMQLRTSEESKSSTSVFKNWMQSSSNINMASFVFSQEIPYTKREKIKCFLNASEELFQDFKNKADIRKKIKLLSEPLKKSERSEIGFGFINSS